uniref:Uncharacterized protein n=1 Tax=Leersia perrieri TaxID=77586 RepID=A0A0D9WYR8_9ORYZ
MSSVLARLVAGQSPAAAFAQPPWLNKQLVTPVVHLARLPSSVTARPSGISATSVVQLLGSCAPPAARRFLVANKAGGSTPGHMEHDDSLLLWITATAQIVLDSLCSLENDIEVELKNTKDKLDRYNFVNKELKKVIGAFKMIVKEEKKYAGQSTS